MKPVIYKQADPKWSKQKLGFGTSTIGLGGCLVTCFAIIGEMLTGKTLTPDVVNARCKIGGAFQNSRLFPKEAARILGLEVVARVDEVPSEDPRIVHTVNEALDAGDLAIVEVDHNQKEGGDHFIVVSGRPPGGPGYEAIDPAGTGALGQKHSLLALDSKLFGVSFWGSKSIRRYYPVGAMWVRRDPLRSTL